MKLHYKILLTVLLITTVLSCTGCISTFVVTKYDRNYVKPLAVDWNADVGDIYYDIPFGSWDDTYYDLYIPKNLRGDKEYALILFIHGGSWNAGDKADEDIWCKYFASKGYITATIDYSLMTEGSDVDINMMNDQIFACVAAIKEDCANRGYEIKQMATSGMSAGGHLAMLYAYSHADDSHIPVKFVFQQVGPAGFHIEYWGGTEENAEELAASTSAWTGKNITPEMVRDGSYRALVNEISPASLVNENTVPTLCAYAANDTLVPPIHKEKLFEQFEKYNVIYRCVFYENSDHTLMNDKAKQEEFIQLALQYCDEYFK